MVTEESRWEAVCEKRGWYQCSYRRASAYVGGPNLLTWYGIYHRWSAKYRYPVPDGRDRGQTAQWQFQRDLWGGVLACPRVSANPYAWSMMACPSKIPGLSSSMGWGEGDRVAELFESTDMVALNTSGIELVKVVRSQIGIGLLLP
jgi:hypothetical protein